MLVSSPEQLCQLPRHWRAHGLDPRAPILIDIEGLPRLPQVRAQQVLNRLLARCGCVAGSIATFVVLTAGLARLYERSSSLVAFATLGEAAFIVLLSFAVGLAVKLGTLLLTRIQFTLECRQQGNVFARLLAGGGLPNPEGPR